MPTPMEPYSQFPFGPAPPYQQRLGPPTILSSSDGSGGSARSGPFALSYPDSTHTMEKDKMLKGDAYLHWLDSVLINDRQNCRAACERYNKAAESTSGISVNERTKLFAQILEPIKRPEYHTRERHRGPTGAIGEHTVVESPFKCDYGYNIHLANECIVEANCYMQDAADISIGSRVVIGNNATFYTIAPSLNTNVRKGAHGRVSAGAIKVEDDVFIGGGATILPYVTIGKGAAVGAGSVVTRVGTLDFMQSYVER